MYVSWITVIWSMIAAVCLTLALVHLGIWLKQRGQRVHLVFSALAVAVAAIAACELLMMRAQTPEQFGAVARWAHVPVFVAVVGIVVFVRLYFGTGRLWLAYGACGMRLLALILNFHFEPNLNYREITDLVPVEMLGETVSVAIGIVNPWTRIGELSSLLLLLFLADASATLWRRGDPAERHRAVVVGGGFGLFVVIAAGNSMLLHAGVIHTPYLISPPFLAIVAAMGYKLSSDVARLAQLSRQLQTSEAKLGLNNRRMDYAAEAAELTLWEWDVARDEIWITDHGRELFGIAPGERLDFDRFLSALHPDDREMARQGVMRSLQDGRNYEREYRVVLPDGRIRWLTSRGRVEVDAHGKAVLLRGVSLDTTARRQALDALRESENRFRVMADTAPVMIWVSSTDKLRIFFSKGWLDFTGRTLGEELGDGWSEGVHRDDRPRCLEVYGNAFDARRGFAMEYRLRRRDGEFRWLLDTGVPRFAPDGTFLGYVGTCMDITESKNAEERFRLVVEAAPSAMIMVNPQGRITMANAQAEAVFGYTRAELMGQPIERLIPECSSFAHSGDRIGVFADSSAGATGAGRELFGRRKDGAEVPMDISLNPIETPEGPMVLASIIDIRERKQNDDRLRQERAFLRQVIDINPNLIFAKDRAGRFTLVNQAVADVYGRTVDEIVGKTHEDFNPDAAEAEFFRRSDQLVMDTLQELFIPEERITDAQGNVRWLQTVKRPILDQDGSASQVLGSSTDITERKRAEMEIGRQRSELAHLSRVTMLGEMSGSLAHELSQPLTAILSNAQAAQRFLARDDVDLGEVRAILKDIVSDDKRAGDIIHGLRLLLKKGELEFQPLDLNDVVLDVLRLVRGDLVHGGISLHTDLARALPMVNGDRVQLQQVLINLVVNGSEAMADNARAERLLVVRTEVAAGEGVRVMVTDHGHGIPPGKLDNVFDAFFTTKPQGLGLGLAVCRTIVSTHGGRLYAANNPGRGASFQFTLPVATR